METARERLFGLLLSDPHRAWEQKELAVRAGCSRGYVSRTAGDLLDAGVLGRPYRTRIVLVSPAKLLTLWASRRRLPVPWYVATVRTPEEIETSLRDRDGVALTLFRAAWHRTKFMATTSVEVYVRRADLEAVASDLGSVSTDPTSVALYPTDDAELEGVEWIAGLPLVSGPQNVVDLMAFGGQGPRVALHLARAFGLWEA